MAAGIPLPDDASLDAQQLAILRAAPLNVFRMSAYVPGVLGPFYDLTVAMLRRGRLDPRSREILVLRTAAVNGADYEARHHGLMAGKLGLSEDEIDRLGRPGAVSGLTPDDALLVRVAEEIARQVGASEETLDALRRRFPVEVVVEIIFCCSYYNMVSRFLVSTSTPFEEGGVAARGALGGLE